MIDMGLNGLYKQATKEVEYMRKHKVHFHPDEDERDYARVVTNLRQLVRRRMADFNESVQKNGGMHISTLTDEQEQLIADVLLGIYKIQRYSVQFELALDTEYIYDDEGNESINPNYKPAVNSDDDEE